jgi:putative tryptophan/tyrosine transport system substrate-binding protein
MRRREFISLVGGAAAWPIAARAQQSESKMPRIGIIDPAGMSDPFRQGLRDLGYIEGRNVTVEYRSAEARSEQLVAVATELAQLPVDVIVTWGSAATQAAKQATTTIPIVMAGIGDPISRLCGEPRPSGGKYHRQYHPGSRGCGQKATAFQIGRSYNFACGLSLESR